MIFNVHAYYYVVEYTFLVLSFLGLSICITSFYFITFSNGRRFVTVVSEITPGHFLHPLLLIVYCLPSDLPLLINNIFTYSNGTIEESALTYNSSISLTHQVKELQNLSLSISVYHLGMLPFASKQPYLHADLHTYQIVVLLVSILSHSIRILY